MVVTRLTRRATSRALQTNTKAYDAQRILRVLAAQQSVQILAEQVRNSYSLGAASTVQSAVGALIESEHLVQEGGRLAFDDPFFRRWVQLNTLADVGLRVLPADSQLAT